MNIDNNRRKRVNRIKTVIILFVILLIVLPMIFCIILGLKVNHLQKQVNELTAAHGLNEITEESSGSNYAYASVKTSDNQKASYITVPPLAVQKSTDTIIKTDKDKYDDVINNKITVHENSEQKKSNSDLSNKNNKDKEKKEPVRKKGIYAGKKVYLTFDDGPSIYTDKILKILADNHIKATFFVIGKTDPLSKNLYKKIINSGNTLGMHSYSHDYEKIYNSVEDFDKDFTKLWKLLYDTTGCKPSIYRFPGGSDNLVNENGMDQFIRYLNEKSIVYFDWNVVNGDATNITYTKEQLIGNVLDDVAKKDTSIVLMHDTQAKKLTVESLPELIKALVTGGAQILPLNRNVKPIQMIKADSIK